MEVGTEFFGDDGGEGGFSESWGAIEEEVSEWFAAFFGGLEQDGESFDDGVLSDDIGEP